MPVYRGWLSFDERLRDSHALANTQRHLENQLRLVRSANDAKLIVNICKQLLARRGDSPTILGILATTYVKLGRLDEAELTIEQALALRSAARCCACEHRSRC